MEALRNNSKIVSTLPPNTSTKERVAMVVPMLVHAITKYQNGDIEEGIVAFQEALVDLIKNAGLLERRWVLTIRVGVHPDNREKAMLVAVDVHDLLLWIYTQGWSWLKVSALGMRDPPDRVGDRMAQGERGAHQNQ